MTTITATAATPPAPRPSGPLPPPLPEPTPGDGGTPRESLRLRIAHWMEDNLGKAAMPVAALAGGVAGGGLGYLALGPVGGVVGGAAGAFFGAALFLAG